MTVKNRGRGKTALGGSVDKWRAGPSRRPQKKGPPTNEPLVEGSPPYQGGVRGGYGTARQQPPPGPLLGKEGVHWPNRPAPKRWSGSQSERKRVFETNHATVRPEEPPSFWRRLEACPEPSRRGLSPRKSTVSAGLAALLVLLLVAAAPAQTGDGYDLSWNSIDGGGGTSTDGDFSVDGTVGQPDAGTLTDGDYTLNGGFWAGVLSGPPAGCVGDCGGNGVVTVDEIITGVNIALGSLPIERCPPLDTNGDGMVTVDELIKAVNNALNGCP